MSTTTNTTALQDGLETNLELQLAQLMVEGNDCLNRAEFHRALECLNRAVSLAPANPDILSHRAQLLWHLKHHDRARADYAKAVAVDSRHVRGNAGLARCYLEQGAHDQAGSYARRSLAADPQNQEAREIVSALEEIAGLKSADARKNLQTFFENRQQEFAGVEPPPLSEWHLKNSRIVPNREEILKLMPQGGVCAEVGTQTGGFAKLILAHLKPTKLHIFDIDFTPFDRPAFAPLIQDGIVELYKGDSSSCLGQQPDHSFDFIYIDGDHAYEGVRKDLAAAGQKIKPDGWIVCNDYTLYSPLEKIQYGVYRAVNEFCWEQGFEIVFLGLHPWGYHDVALRRMPLESLALAGPSPVVARPPLPGPNNSATQTAKRFLPVKRPDDRPRIGTVAEYLSGVKPGTMPGPVPASQNPSPARILPPTYDLDPGLTLDIGEHSYIHDRKIRNPSGAVTNISIGNFCCIATGLSIIGYDHHSEWAAMYPFLDDGHRANWPGTSGIPYPQSAKFGSNKSRGDIAIGNDVWIGSDVKLFKGVTIGDGAVIGACSLVNKSIEPYTMVAGIPARPIRKRFSQAEIELLQKIKWWELPASVINRHLALLCSSRIGELTRALEADPEFQNFRTAAKPVVKRTQPRPEAAICLQNQLAGEPLG
jgi:acetyltransferase-like isoleucine patch superfamily enzyme/tetratricopeptide (TPR) repeat protein